MVYNLLTTYIRTILIIYALEGTTMNIIHHIYVLCIHVLHGCGDRVDTIKLHI